MKIAVPATGGSMSARVSEQFGRCAYFLVVDTRDMRFEPIHNPGAEATGGAGPQAAQELIRRGVEVVLTGSLGPKAAQVLERAGIKVVSGISAEKTVKEAVEEYLHPS